MVEFPAKPRNAFWSEPKANARPPMSKLVVASTTPPCTSPLAVTFPVTPTFPVKLFAPRVADGEQVNGSGLNARHETQALDARLSVVLPPSAPEPPPVRPVPAVTVSDG